jgi:protocatechuate 3,4-dioxygenase beta subunit
VGTASIGGVVVTDDERAQPVRRARVILSGPEATMRQMKITDDDGRFAFVGLAAGRFTLLATKEAYATVTFGAKRPGGPGTSIVLADRQQAGGLTIRLPRGAVITGTVVDQNGQPTARISVSASRYTFINSGEQRLAPTRTSSTNDRGQYRIYSLAPGEYCVAASPPRGGGAPGTGDLRAITPADIAKAKQDLTARPNADGKFSFASVSPGQYVLAARANAPGAPRSAASTAPVSTLWAMLDLAVDGTDILNAALDLQPGLTVSGRVQFEATELTPPDPSRLRVSMAPPPARPASISHPRRCPWPLTARSR